MDKESLKKAIFKEIMDYHVPQKISLAPVKAVGLPMLQTSLKPAVPGSGMIKLSKSNNSIKPITLQKASNAAPVRLIHGIPGSLQPAPKQSDSEKQLQNHLDTLKSNIVKHSIELGAKNGNLPNDQFRTPLVPLVKRTNMPASSLAAPSSDIDMLSAKSTDSVDMVSANPQSSNSTLSSFVSSLPHQQTVPEVKKTSKSKGPPKKTISEDTKTILKDALLNAELRKQQGIYLFIY